MSHEGATVQVGAPLSQTLDVPVFGEKVVIAAKRRFPWGLALWWLGFVFILPVLAPVLITSGIEFFQKGQLHNSLREMIRSGDLLLAIGLFACAICFDAYLLKTKIKYSNHADVVILFGFSIALVSFCFYSLCKAFGMPKSIPWADHAFFWCNIIIYTLCGVLAMTLRIGDLFSIMNKELGV